jgi:hypothetical protein
MTRRLLLAALPAMGQHASYEQEIAAYRVRRIEELKSGTGWLTLAGLHWLEPGVPIQVEGIPFLLRGKSVSTNGKVLKPDTDLIRQGTFTMFVIERGGRFAVRVRDSASAHRKQFQGTNWYAVKPEYRVHGRLKPHPEQSLITVPTVIEGIAEKLISPGVVEFTLAGVKCTLEPVLSGDELFFIFKDRTAGKTTYAAGRFLYTPLPVDNSVELDFNKAINPPCAFTPYATCPLPPRQNYLRIPIEAGERNYTAGHSSAGIGVSRGPKES